MKYLFPFILILLPFLQGCSLVRSFAGANVDHVRYEKARAAAALEMRYHGALRLADRLQRDPDPGSADIVLELREEFLVRTLQRLQGSEGWLDDRTSYRIDAVQAEMHPGSAIVTLDLLASNADYGVDVRLLMDCGLAFSPEGDELVMEFEPYNVIPAATAGGLLATAERLIEDVIRVRLGSLREQFPPVRLPLGFDDVTTIDGTSNRIQGTPNMHITTPRRLIDYRLRVVDVLLFDRVAVVGINLETMQVR